MSFLIRPAEEGDCHGIREIFEVAYGADYAYQEFYDEQALKKMIFSDETLMLVAEDTAAGGRLAGTASVVLEIGAFSDLVGEFGRLVVHPDYRGQGLGNRLMEGRLEHLGDRIHVGLVEARVTHPFSVKIAESHGFAPVGFLPLKLRFGPRREHGALLVRYFGSALDLRANHPRLIPEAYRLAAHALQHIGLAVDVIVDETAPPYPPGEPHAIEVLSAEAYTRLLRIERGRLHRREIFGPARLHYGFFKLRRQCCTYLVAKENDQILGAVGFALDRYERTARIFELITTEDRAIRHLLEQAVEQCRGEWDVDYVEIDVRADGARMQRTLLELGFIPVAYVPALAFHRVQRLDVLKMARLLAPLEPVDLSLTETFQSLARLVLRAMEVREAQPRITEMAAAVGLFAGLGGEQLERLAGLFAYRRMAAGERLFEIGTPSREMFVVLDGEVTIDLGAGRRSVGRVQAGESLGEVALLTGGPHAATAMARSEIEVAVLTRLGIEELVRQRPDIGVILYRNLARGLGEKLRRADTAMAEDGSAGRLTTG